MANNDGGQNKLTEYVAGTVYTNGRPSFAATEEGRMVPDGNGGWRHEYFLKDHLGNTRAVVAGTLIPGGVDLLQTTSYYPFGLPMAQTDYNSETTDYRKNRYLYNGKELQSDGFGGVELGWLDYGARYYDPALGRWHSVDPDAESYFAYGPYVYVGNNPIRRIDPDGNNGWDVVMGFAAAIVDNASGRLIDARSSVANLVTDAKDFNAGLISGDVVSITLGGAEISGGAGMIEGGATAVVAGAAVSATGVGVVAGGLTPQLEVLQL